MVSASLTVVGFTVGFSLTFSTVSILTGASCLGSGLTTGSVLTSSCLVSTIGSVLTSCLVSTTGSALTSCSTTGSVLISSLVSTTGLVACFFLVGVKSLRFTPRTS